jgi:hypothetical protein
MSKNPASKTHLIQQVQRVVAFHFVTGNDWRENDRQALHKLQQLVAISYEAGRRYHEALPSNNGLEVPEGTLPNHKQGGKDE